ncbi:hypothetical protein FQN49_003962 [Arthroderma sp. PD_2]|nr:hypothetical protein FQN49_003962 [Arthroderma sp. PD_2]
MSKGARLLVKQANHHLLSAIHTAIETSTNIPWHDLGTVVDRIYSGARRIFAILVVLKEVEEISRFLESDHFQASPLDHKLPFSITDLETLVPNIAVDFFEKQWEFAAPVFTRDERNFIFPLADGGDLEAFLKSDSWPRHFTEDSSFYSALCGLSSAIEKIHDYTTEKYVYVRLKGQHQDLKPSNILVDFDRFIVADFGLAKFISETQTSNTPFIIGGGDYLAPECEDLRDLKKGFVNRLSDIWSFGCIIVDILTFMQLGKEGVMEFRKKPKD